MSGDSPENEEAQSREPAQARSKRSACLRTDVAAADRAQRVSGCVVSAGAETAKLSYLHVTCEYKEGSSTMGTPYSIQKAGHSLKISGLQHSEVGQRRRNGKAAGRADVVVTGESKRK
jgi:hypothetical protein